MPKKRPSTSRRRRRPTRRGAAPPTPVYAGTFGRAQAERLLWRAGFGPKPGQAEELAALGVRKAVAQLLEPPSQKLTGPGPVNGKGSGLFPAHVWGHDHLWWLDRMVRADAPLIERMTLIWHDWFATSRSGVPTAQLMLDQNQLLREHCMGSFSELAVRITKDPAMLVWLSGIGNTAAAPNENYARELMELHTLGVTGGYTQQDVEQMARVFTGWTITPQRSGRIEFVYVPALHDAGDKVVLGRRIPSSGRAEGEEVLDLLARDPATAEHVVRKLVSRFVADVPPEALVQRAKGVWLASDGDLAAVLRTILESDELFAPASRAAKVKSPLELVASALRAAHADVRLGFGAAKLVASLGQPILRAEPPTGWAETADAVVTAGGMVTRFDLATAVARNRVGGVRIDVSRWARLAGGSRDGDALAASLLLAPPGADTRVALIEARDAGATADVLAALVLSSPEFQQQ